MNYTFIHAFRDGSKGIGKMKHPIKIGRIYLYAPKDASKRWLKEMDRWMEEVIIPKAEELDNKVSIEFEFQFFVQQ